MFRLPDSWNSPQHTAHRRLHALIHFVAGAVDGSDNQILQHFHVPGLDCLGITPDVQHLLSPVHFHRYAPAAGGAFDDGFLHSLLQDLVLLLRLRHQFLNIESVHIATAFRSNFTYFADNQ